MDENFDFQFKVIVIGDSGVGKTCVVQTFAYGVYTDDQQSTIGLDFILRSMDIDGKKVKMQVWDTAGQEHFRTITRSYYRGVDAAIIAYDITRRSSFESVPHWIDDVKMYGDADTVIMLMGTKSDLCERQQVPFEEACALAENFSLLDALETSAKESRNINEAFELMARLLIARNSLSPLSSVFYSMNIVMAACGQGSQGSGAACHSPSPSEEGRVPLLASLHSQTGQDRRSEYPRGPSALTEE
ncbi:ras-related protein Rab-19-like [Sorex araneus]|uniref:ras-related protein Rab-19-like n=1 Tax=Sorex araneus TaxID=42254 RepID=UPI0024336B70|nr:ras-related protein Rab-19-like [Sorex araneus]